MHLIVSGQGRWNSPQTSPVTSQQILLKTSRQLHDSSTGSSLGSYGNFEIVPLLCPISVDSCTTSSGTALSEQLRWKSVNITPDNGLEMEATSIREGLEWFTFSKYSKPDFSLDLNDDFPESFAGGSVDIHQQRQNHAW